MRYLGLFLLCVLGGCARGGAGVTIFDASTDAQALNGSSKDSSAIDAQVGDGGDQMWWNTSFGTRLRAVFSGFIGTQLLTANAT